VISRAAGRDVSPGEKVEIRLDRVVLSGNAAPPALVRVRDLGRPWSAEDLILTMDFQAPEIEAKVPRSRALCRDLAESFGLRHVYDLNLGIGSHVVLESTLVRPGDVVAGCGRCLGVLGGIGAFPIRLGEEELAQAILTGKVTIQAPATLRVDVQGQLSRFVGAVDLAAAIAAKAGDSLRGRVVELGGRAKEWSVDFRVGLTGLLAEMGAAAAVVPADAVTARFYKERGVAVEESPKEGRNGKDGSPRVIIEAKKVVPGWGSDYVGPRRPLPAKDGDGIQGVFIGSCYGGRYEDMSLVAEILKRAGKVHPGVRLVVSPATLETARGSLAAGFYETFLDAGSMVIVPGGGPGSAGGAGIFGDGERIGTTAEYHRQLRPGQGVPEVAVLSPAAAAVAAATGTLTDPAAFFA
jgi:3-isopropylmalate/(R)-2-methylmalate dehydratase large subunit